MQISAGHPLRKLFDGLVYHRVYDDAHVRDRDMADYIVNLLTDFADARNLYRIRNVRGRRLEDVGEMLIESNPLLNASSFDREREVRKHIGDYTLFMTGLFPEYVASLPRRGLRLDAFIDYVKAGKESYRIVSCFNQFEYRQQAALFAHLADSFELCAYGLNLVKQDLERFQQRTYDRMRTLLGS